MTYSLEPWLACQQIYEGCKAKLITTHPGMYYLVDTHTRNAAFGDPKLDPLNSGQVDAFLNFERMHGYKHGEFFGVLIPKSNQDL